MDVLEAGEIGRNHHQVNGFFMDDFEPRHAPKGESQLRRFSCLDCPVRELHRVCAGDFALRKLRQLSAIAFRQEIGEGDSAGIAGGEEISVGALRIFRRHSRTAVKSVQIARIRTVLVIFRECAQRKTIVHGRAVLAGRELRSVGPGGTLANVSQAIARAHTAQSSGTIGIREGPRTVNGEAVAREAKNRRMRGAVADHGFEHAERNRLARIGGPHGIEMPHVRAQIGCFGEAVIQLYAIEEDSDCAGSDALPGGVVFDCRVPRNAEAQIAHAAGAGERILKGSEIKKG